MLNLTRLYVLSAATLALFAGACSSSEPTTAPTRSFAPTATLSRDATPIAGRHIFVMSSVPADFADRVAAKGGTIVDNFAEAGTVVTSGLSDTDAAVLASGGVVANDVTAQWVPSAEELNASAVSLGDPVAATVRSPFSATALSLQWNMFQIHAPDAWAAGKFGSPTVNVAILDSGIDPDHRELSGLVNPNLSARVIASPTACLFSHAKSLWADNFYHGTYVSGIVTTNDSSIAGVAPNVRLVAVKVLDSLGSGSFSDIICGLQYAVLIARPRVINMSLGATFKGNTAGLVAFQQFFAQFVNFANSQGVVVVSASGNDGKNLGVPHPFMALPCEAGAQLCVSATGPSDHLAHYSNFGRSAIAVAAPGGENQFLPKNPTPAQQFAALILGPCARALCGTERQYLVAAGTSAAAPHVSGLAALIASQNPMLSASAIMSIIEQTADDVGSAQQFGNGRINVARALGVPLP
jgi:subtilisin family serine protease